MKPKSSGPLHPEEAKLAGILLCLFGTLVAIMGAMMWRTLIGDSEVDGSGSATLVWFGVAAVVHGMTIRKTRRLMPKPLWTYMAFLFGIASMYRLHLSIGRNDVVGAVGMIPMQIFALFALWHSSWRQVSQQTKNSN